MGQPSALGAAILLHLNRHPESGSSRETLFRTFPRHGESVITQEIFTLLSLRLVRSVSLGPLTIYWITPEGQQLVAEATRS